MRIARRALLCTAAGLTALTTVAAVAQAAPEPPLTPTPQGECGAGSRPESGAQGRVSKADHDSGRAAKGYTCNSELVGSYRNPVNPQGTVGGYKVERYVDAAGHECAFYDSTLLYPTNAVDANVGVNVLDMSDPAKPVLTDRLVTPAMLSPHKSLVLSQERGLLAAINGNPSVGPGIVDVYDVSADCRHPKLRASSPAGVFGHESGMAPDGRTFYAGSPLTQTIVAVDLDNPVAPRPLWTGNYPSHGLSISADGNRAYVAGVGAGLIILDTSEIQARRWRPQVREIARLDWTSRSIPQNAIPITIKGHPYVVEVDEFGGQDAVGAARIIDIGDEKNPYVLSNLRLAVHQPENFAAQAGDPGPTTAAKGYSAHYCNVPTRTDPTIVACSMILSGLRVFDIRDPAHPREIAYFNAPVTPRAVMDNGNWAMSSPAFVPQRREIWYTDGFRGFFAVRLTNNAWPATGTRPAAAGGTSPSASPGPGTGDGKGSGGGTGDAPATPDADRPAERAGGPLASTGAIVGGLLSLGLGLVALGVIVRRRHRRPGA